MVWASSGHQVTVDWKSPPTAIQPRTLPHNIQMPPEMLPAHPTCTHPPWSFPLRMSICFSFLWMEGNRIHHIPISYLGMCRKHGQNSLSSTVRFAEQKENNPSTLFRRDRGARRVSSLPPEAVPFAVIQARGKDRQQASGVAWPLRERVSEK